MVVFVGLASRGLGRGGGPMGVLVYPVKFAFFSSGTSFFFVLTGGSCLAIEPEGLDCHCPCPCDVLIPIDVFGGPSRLVCSFGAASLSLNPDSDCCPSIGLEVLRRGGVCDDGAGGFIDASLLASGLPAFALDLKAFVPPLNGYD